MQSKEDLETKNIQIKPNTLYFAKTNPTAIIPTKREEDAGYDLYACFEDDFIMIQPHRTIMIPTGVACCCSRDYCLILKERGSTGSKGIAQRCGVIDSGYRGEIFVPVTNTNYKTVIIAKKTVISDFESLDYIITYPYEKAIAQALVIPVPCIKATEITYDELKAITSERSVGMLGSSGK